MYASHTFRTLWVWPTITRHQEFPVLFPYIALLGSAIYGNNTGNSWHCCTRKAWSEAKPCCQMACDAFPEVGNTRVNPRFHPTNVGWNLLLTRNFQLLHFMENRWTMPPSITAWWPLPCTMFCDWWKLGLTKSISNYHLDVRCLHVKSAFSLR